MESTSLLLGMELTGHCNLRCGHCLRDDRESIREFDVDLFRKIVSQSGALGNPFFAFGGGEPTLHSVFESFVEILAEHGRQCRLVTNGTNFSQLLSFLLTHKRTMTEISVSLDGADAKTHDALRGHGSFSDATMAIALAVKGGWPVTVQCAVNRYNYLHLPELAALCADLGVSTLLFSPLLPVSRAARAGLLLSADQWCEVEECVETLRQNGPLPVGITTGKRDRVAFAHCETMRHLSYSIDCDGYLTFCCQLSGAKGAPDNRDRIADLRETPLVEAISAHMEMTAEVMKKRLRYFEENPDDPDIDFHCHFCLNHFGKDMRPLEGAGHE